MTLEKAIVHGKEHRKGYKERGKPGRYARSCRPHGSCPYCRRARLFHALLEEAIAKEQLGEQQNGVL